MESKSINPELMFQEFFNNMNYCAVLYEAIDNGENFILKAVNNAGERKKIPKISKLNSSQLNEINLENFDYNFFNHMKKVWKSGNPVSITIETRANNNNPLHPCEFFIFKIYSNYIAAIFNEITPYKFTENIKNDSKILYKYIMDNLNDLIGILDSDFKYCYVNKSYEKILGYSQDNLIGTHPIGHVHPDDFELAMKTTYLGIKSGKAKADVRYLNKNGEELWYELNGTYFTDIYGNKKSLLISRGINDRKVAKLNIRESEEKYRSLFERYEMLLESITDAVFVINRDWVYTLVNKSAEKIVNMPLEKLIGHKVIDVFPSIDQTSFFKTYESVMNTGEPDRIIDSFTLPDGRTGCYEVSMYPISEGILCIGRDITEEEMAKQKLKESEEQYRHLFEQSPIIIVIIDYDGTFISVNSPFLNYFGYKREELVGKKFTEIERFSTENVLFFRKTFKEAVSKGIFKPVEFRAYDKNRDQKWMELRASSIEIEGSKMVQVFIQDIDKRKRAELALKESKEYLDNIIENIHDIIIESDENQNIVFISPQSEDVFGFKPHEIIGRNAFDLIHPDDLNHVIEEISSLKYVKDRIEIDYRFLHKQGHYIDILGKGGFYFQNGSKRFIEVLRDNTERKKDEEKLKKSEENYKQLSNELEIILDGLPGLVFYKDDKNNFIRVNKYVADALNLSKKQLEGKSCFDLYPKEQAQAYWDDDLEVISSRKPKLNIEEPWETESGKAWVSTSKIPYINENGDIRGIIGISMDITECKIAEQKLRKSEERLKYLVSSSPTMIYSSRASGDFGGTFISENVYEQTGYLPKDFITDPEFWLSKIHPEDKERVLSELSELAEKEHLIYDYRFKFKEGTYYWMRDEVKLVKDENGNPIETIGSWINITDRKIVEERIKESEEKFRTIAEQSLMGIGIAQDNRIKYVNKTYADIFGYTVEEMMNWTFEDVRNAIYFDDLEFILTQFKKKQFGDNNIFLNYQYRGVKKNGDVIWIDNYSKPIIYEGNYADLVTIVDITEKINARQERKLAEEKLKRSEEDYRMIFNQSPDYIFITDSKGYLLNANPVLLEKLNLSLDDIQGKNAIDFFAGDNYDKVIETFKSVRKGIEVKNLEISIQNKYGELFDLEVNSVPIKKNENEINILNIARDITEKKLAEKALQENKLLLERTLNSLKEAVFIMDAEIPPKILYFNPAAKRIFGYSRKELNGQSMELLHVDNTSLKKFQQIIFSKIEEKGFVGDFEFHMKRKDGSIFPTEHYVNTLENEKAERIGWISIVRDVTEREKTEEKSKELDIIKADFVYRASHELKTPLTSIYSASQLLLKNFENFNRAQIHEFIQIINQGGKRLKALITDLLDISKIESKKLQIEKKREDIIKLLNECINEIKFKAFTNYLSLHINLPKEFYLDIDKPKIIQLFLNILSNAVNYTPPRGELFINFRNLKESIEFEIKDTGIGFTDEEKKLIFKKFGKIERYGKGMEIITEGSGLGLYISQEIAKMHGGNIRVESEGRNKGSSFYITLPKN